MKKIFEKVKADKRIIIGYSASLFLLLVTYIVTLLANKELKERSDKMDHTYNVLFNLEAILSTIKDAETGVRGYALTRDVNFLDPFINSKQISDSLYKQLLFQTKDNPVQNNRLVDLKSVMERRFEI